jgi:hypothetical protein
MYSKCTNSLLGGFKVVLQRLGFSASDKDLDWHRCCCQPAQGNTRACPMAPGPGPGPEPPVAPIGHALVFPGRGPGPVAPLDTP